MNRVIEASERAEKVLKEAGYEVTPIRELINSGQMKNHVWECASCGGLQPHNAPQVNEWFCYGCEVGLSQL